MGVTGEELQKWCALFGHPLYLVGAGRLLADHEPAEQGGRIVACYMWDGHAYVYRDGRALKNYKKADHGARSEWCWSTKRRASWSHGASKSCSGKPEPGLFYVSDLAWERRRMLESGRSPKVSLRDMTTVAS